jgi:hypothetical protein
LLGRDIEQGTSTSRRLESESGYRRALAKEVADLLYTNFDIGKGINSLGPYQLRRPIAEAYFLENQESLGLSDEQVHDSNYQRQALESPTQSKEIFQWLIGRLSQDWQSTFGAIGYPNISLTDEQMTTLVYPINYSQNAIARSLLANSIYNAAVNEGLISAGTKMDKAGIESLATTLAERWGIEDTSSSAIFSKGTLRDFVTFMRSDMGRKVIDSIGGPQNIVPTASEVIDNNSGSLVPLRRGANIYKDVVMQQWQQWQNAATNTASIGSADSSILNFNPNIQASLNSNYNAPATTIVTPMRLPPAREQIRTVPDVKGIKDKSTVSGTVVQ